MKKHSFFEGIDFEKISQPEYDGAHTLVSKLLKDNIETV